MEFIATVFELFEGAILGLLFMLAIAALFTLPVLLIYSIVMLIAYKVKYNKIHKPSMIIFCVCMVFVVLIVICIAWLTDGFSQGISFM